MVRQSLPETRGDFRRVQTRPYAYEQPQESYPLAPEHRKMLKQLLFPGFYWRSQSVVSTIATEVPCFARCRRIISELLAESISVERQQVIAVKVTLISLRVLFHSGGTGDIGSWHSADAIILPSLPARAVNAAVGRESKARRLLLKGRSGTFPFPSRCTMTSARSAGVMPLMRLACDKIRGRTRESFSRASARSWTIASYRNPSGIRFSDSRHCRSISVCCRAT